LTIYFSCAIFDFNSIPLPMEVKMTLKQRNEKTIIDLLTQQPHNSKELIELSKIPKPTVFLILKRLQGNGVIEKEGKFYKLISQTKRIKNTLFDILVISGQAEGTLLSRISFPKQDVLQVLADMTQNGELEKNGNFYKLTLKGLSSSATIAPITDDPKRDYDADLDVEFFLLERQAIQDEKRDLAKRGISSWVEPQIPEETRRVLKLLARTTVNLKWEMAGKELPEGEKWEMTEEDMLHNVFKLDLESKIKRP
jgi:DNA-binding MarR family transcriptional regulator